MAEKEYDVLRTLGAGAFGTAFLVMHKKSKSEMVLKKHKLASLTKEEKDKAFGEVVAMAGLHHDHIVKFLSYFWAEDGNLAIVMEYCVGGSLQAMIDSHKKPVVHFSEDRIVRWFRQCADALDHVHRRNKMHRDLKPDNILLTDTEGTSIKLTDFGLSISVDSISAKVKPGGFSGTPAYAAPEMFDDEEFSNRCDLWALGVVFYEVINLSMPFKTIDELRNAKYPKLRTSASRGLQKIVEELLSVDPKERPRCDEILKLPILQEHASGLEPSMATWRLNDASERNERSEKSEKSDSALSTSTFKISDKDLYSASLTTAALDLAFVIDCTNSMTEYLEAVKKNINYIVDEISKAGIADVRVALVEYRDHPEVGAEFVTRKHEFTEDMTEMKTTLSKCTVGSGGDVPEAVADALNDLVHLNWRPNATKMAALVCDAPPHGIGIRGDRFPNGSPNGYDPLVLCKLLAEKGVRLNVVGCEPHVLPFTELFSGLAFRTGGKYFPLGDAKQLADLIIATAKEGFSMNALLEQVRPIVRQIEEGVDGDAIDEDALVRRVHEELTKRDVRSQTVFQGDRPLEKASIIAKQLANCSNLDEMKTSVRHVASSSPARAAEAAGGTRSQYRSKTTTVTLEQTERMVKMVRSERKKK